MREGEPLFDWEKVVIEKRRNMIAKHPAFEDRTEEEAPALENEAPNQGLLGWCRALLGRREGE